jgi:hypothetical protein
MAELKKVRRDDESECKERGDHSGARGRGYDEGMAEADESSSVSR